MATVRRLRFCAAVLALPLAAQQPEAAAAENPLAQATARLERCLDTTAAQPSCAFAAKWGEADEIGREDGDEDGGDGQAADPRAGNPFGMLGSGKADGTCTTAALHVSVDGGVILLCGRRQLVQDDQGHWVSRQGRFADGNRIGFVPDPQRLIEVLHDLDLRVVHRQVTTLEDRPVEVLTVELNAEQAAALVWNDLLPSPLGVPDFQIALGGLRNVRKARPQAPLPDFEVDLALYVDPGTGLVHRVHCRLWRAKQAAGQFVFVGGGGGRVVMGGRKAGKDDDEDEQEPAPAAADAGPQFESGLPVRDRKDKSIQDYVIDLRDHGTARLPDLDGTAKEALQRLTGGR